MNLNKIHKVISDTTGILWDIAIGMSVINFVEKPSLVTALGVVLILGACCFMEKDENEQEDTVDFQDLEVLMLKNEIAALNAVNKASEALIKSSDRVIEDLKEQVKRLEEASETLYIPNDDGTFTKIRASKRRLDRTNNIITKVDDES